MYRAREPFHTTMLAQWTWKATRRRVASQRATPLEDVTNLKTDPDLALSFGVGKSFTEQVGHFTRFQFTTFLGFAVLVKVKENGIAHANEWVGGYILWQILRLAPKVDIAHQMLLINVIDRSALGAGQIPITTSAPARTHEVGGICSAAPGAIFQLAYVSWQRDEWCDQIGLWPP